MNRSTKSSPTSPKNVEHIKEIISVQQTMAKSSGLMQELHGSEIIRDVLTADKESLRNHAIDVQQLVADPDPTFTSDKHRILQILINLVRNAKDALIEAQVAAPKITLRVWEENDEVCFEVADNGIGIDQDSINKIFQHGFTTKKHGHGFGLHSSANAATEIGGHLSVASGGARKGAQFVLRIPTRAGADATDTDTETDGANDKNEHAHSIETGSGDFK